MYEYNVCRVHPNDKEMCKMGIFEIDLQLILQDFQNEGWEFISTTKHPSVDDDAVICIFRKEKNYYETQEDFIKSKKDIPVYFFNQKTDKQVGNDIELPVELFEQIKLNKQVEFESNYYDIAEIVFDIKCKRFAIYITV